MRLKLWVVVAGVIAGIVFASFAVADLRAASGDIECAGETMIEGDECMSLGGGVRTVDEQRDAYRRTGFKKLAAAAACLAAAGALYHLHRRGRLTTAPPGARGRAGVRRARARSR